MATETEQTEIPNASDLLAGMGQLDVDKFITSKPGHPGIQKVLGKELIFLGIYERTSAYDGGDGTFLAVKAQLTTGKSKGKTIGFNTGSDVLMKQLRELEQHFPAKGVIEHVKAGKYQNYYQIRQ